MSKISVDAITDEAGTGAPDFPNGISATGPFTSLGIDDNATSTAITVDSAGKLGVGTASPTEKLDVAGTVKATSFSGDGSALTGIGVTGYGTQVATTSGTAFDFTGIPAGVNKVTMVCKGVSLNGINLHLIQLGTSGGIVGDGYVGAGGTLVNTGVNEVSTTNGLAIRLLNSGRDLNGSAVFTRMSSGGTVWAAQAVFGDANAVYMSGASVDIGGELTQVRLTRSGSNTFDAGAANISWSY